MELMVDVSCGAESWMPAALADALCAHRPRPTAPRAHPDALELWLRAVRRTTEEYDPGPLAPPTSPPRMRNEAPPAPAARDPPSPEPPETPEDAFDDILGQIGREIFQLDEYQRRIAPVMSGSLADSILELFDVCLDEMTGLEADRLPSGTDSSSATFETASPTADGDAASMLSEEAFATSTPNRLPAAPSESVEIGDDALAKKAGDVNTIFDDGNGAPVPPKRRNRRGTLSSGSSIYDNMDQGSPKPRPRSNVESLKSRLDSDSDSSSTNWSYRACSTDSDNGSREDYAPVWSCSTGFHNSDDLINGIISQHRRRLSHESVDALALDRLYELPVEEGCDKKGASVDTREDTARRSVESRPAAGARDMKPTDSDYDLVRDARDDDKYDCVLLNEETVGLVEENIYEEIEYASSDRSSGSVEVVSCDESVCSEEQQEPMYANLLDNDAYAIGGDVIAWRQRLFHPDYCDDEEDEWISNEESLIYGQEQRRPPFIIPRITSYRPARHRDPSPLSYPEETLADVPLAMKDVRHVLDGARGVGDWSPLSERSKMEIERSETLADVPLAMKDVRHVLDGARGVGDWSPLSERSKMEIERSETLADVPLAMKDVRHVLDGARGVGDWSPLSERSKMEIERSETLADVPLAMKDVRHVLDGARGVGDWSPLSERSKMEIERSFSKAGSGSPPLLRLPKRLGGSNENLLAGARRPSNPYLGAQHSSGDSLDLELRAQRPHDRRRKSKSMVPSRAGKSPAPPRAAAPPALPAPPAPSPHRGDQPDGLIFDSTVRRTKFSENGKKARKHWTESHLVLTPTHLLFYKDAKAFHAAVSKGGGGGGAPASPSGARGAELALPLKGATVERCTQQHTSRYTRSIVVTSGGDQLLIQDESPAGAAYWYESIERAISRLPGDFRGMTPQLDSYGTPPAARKQKNKNIKVGDSSNEDLSDSTDHAKVRNKLRKFFTRRPTMEVLIKKGIYKDEPVFGQQLEAVCPKPDVNPRVPEFVVRCVQEIESSESNMHTDGLYRASGNLSQVQKIRLEIDQHHLDIFEHINDVHVLTGSLKLFFRELKEPLIPCKLFNRILAATSIKSRDARTKEFRDIVSNLPQCNWDTLKFLLEHLLRVTEQAAHNRMHIANLAIVFGPTLLWAPAELAHNIAIDCIQQNHAIEILLTDFHQIFSNTRPKKKS